VRLHQARGHQPLPDVGHLTSRAQVVTDGRDAPDLDADVGGVRPVGKAAAAQEEVSKSGPILLMMNGSFQGVGHHLESGMTPLSDGGER